MKRRLVGNIGIAALLLVVLLTLTTVWAKQNGTFSSLDLIVDVRHELMHEYYKKPNVKKLTESAVRGMVDSLNDPFTVYLAPDELSSFEREVHGKFSGIGAQVDMRHGILHIVTPLEDSPAWKAGIMAGDTVLKINGQSTRGMKLSDAVNLLTGAQGTKVTLQVRHPSGKVQNIAITRQIINVRTVRGFRRIANQHFDFMIDHRHKIGYIRITQFTEDTADEVHDALQSLIKQHMKGLIIDVRFNPGGLLESAVQIGSMFLKGGKTIVSVKGRVVPRKVYRASAADTIPDVPIVIIANEASASAAEILTGALADNHRALFLGTRTFGKGSVQQVRMLQSGQGALKITNAHYYLPNGRNINRNPDSKVWGVDPSPGEYVPMTPKQVLQMVKVRRKDDIVSKNGTPATAPADVDPNYIEHQLKDPQLADALKAILVKLKTGTWPRLGKSHATELALAAERGNLIKERNQLEAQLQQVDQRLDTISAGRPTTEPTASGKPTPRPTNTQPSPISHNQVQRSIEKAQGQPVPSN